MTRQRRGDGKEEFPSAGVMKIHLDLQISLGISSVVRLCMNLTEKCKEKLMSLLSKLLFITYMLFTQFSSYSMEICKEFSLNLRRKNKTFSELLFFAVKNAFIACAGV